MFMTSQTGQRDQLGADHLFLPYIKLFKRAKKGLELVSFPYFCMIFNEKYFSRYDLLTDQISFLDCLYFLKYCSIGVL